MNKRFVLALGLLLLAAVPGAFAQVSGGNIYGTVTDESGAVLPGANITISGTTLGARTTTSGTAGDFRFLNLDPGTYKLSVNLAGFGTVNRDVIVNTGTNANISFALKLATVEETVTITAETPVVDTKKMGTSTTLTKEELAQVPQGRDPWAVLKTVPGVIVDRVSVAGNEAGQQSVFVAKGAQPTDTMYNLDGVVITDTT
jgi:carboxypeptidase family protein